jgi:transglutaminase-like putative cysteine protease/uncharacterized alpha-E superfamily protein
MMLRVFAVADGPQSWRVLPGGLARLASASEGIATMQRGGSSADAWVLTDVEKGETVDRTTLLAPHQTPAAVVQRKRLVTSRAAENLFWMGRYTERAENSIRLARITINRLNGEDVAAPALLAWLGDMAMKSTLVLPGVPSAVQARRVFERSLIASLDSRDGATSVGYNLRALKLNASSVRERLSQEHWSIITRAESQFSHDCAAHAAQGDWSAADALRTLEAASNDMAAITGAQTDRMTRDDGWRLLSIGRLIERLCVLAPALASGFQTGAVHDSGGFEALVALFDSTITFHAQYQQSRDVAAWWTCWCWTATTRARWAGWCRPARAPGQAGRQRARCTGCAGPQDARPRRLDARPPVHAGRGRSLQRSGRLAVAMPGRGLATVGGHQSALLHPHLRDRPEPGGLMELRITHETRYDYSPAVETAQHMAHLHPLDTPASACWPIGSTSHRRPRSAARRPDVYGNLRTFFSLQAPHTVLRVVAVSEVETRAPQPAPSTVAWEAVRERFRYRAGAAWDAAAEFVFASHHAPRHDAFSAYARPSFPPGRALIEAARDLMARIHDEFTYETFSTEVNTPALEALERRTGVCQDFAHIMIGCLRAMGVPARYVSGYLLTHPPAGQPRLIGSDASHAWVAVYLPDLPGAQDGNGWYDLDPTNNRSGWGTPGEDYVTLALGRDYLRRVADARRDSRRRATYTHGGRDGAAGACSATTPAARRRVRGSAGGADPPAAATDLP